MRAPCQTPRALPCLYGSMPALRRSVQGASKGRSLKRICPRDARTFAERSNTMKGFFLLIAAFAAVTGSACPDTMPQFAPGFSAHTAQADGRTIYYRIGGSGPAVLLLHGIGDTGEMWAALAPGL